jgi:hypothetical protein
MYALPITVDIKDKTYHIRNKGDYRLILDCFNALNDVELSETERILSSVFIFCSDFEGVEDVLRLNEEELTELVNKMFDFMNCGGQQGGSNTDFKAVDWDKDEQLICSAINNVANTEIRSVEYCHWWTFMGYYLAIGESPLSTVVGIRNKIAKGKKLEKYEQEFRRDNPQYFIWDKRTLKQKEDDALLNQLWNKE